MELEGPGKEYLEQARVKARHRIAERVNQGCQRKFPIGHRAAGAKVELQSWARLLQWAEHLRRAASQQLSWFGSHSQPHPWFCRVLSGRQHCYPVTHQAEGLEGSHYPSSSDRSSAPPLHRSPRGLKAHTFGAQSSGQEGWES